MSIFKRKNRAGRCNVLTEEYVPASLPCYGKGLENFVAGEYSMTKPAVIKEAYNGVEAALGGVIAACDHHSEGSECDHYIDADIEHITAAHEAEVADHENQIARIRSARQMRKAALERMIDPLREKAEKLQAEIAPLEGLRAQFQVHIGSHAFSIGLPITIAAMIIDAAVNFNFLQSMTFSNAYLLMVLVACLSVMSDASMWALATTLSRRREAFTSKPLYYTICASLLAMFLLSVAASFMIRWGSMDVTYGTINSAGEFVPKDTYSLAEYGMTLVTSFVTTATGILSFAFSLDENGYLVSRREHEKKELARCSAELEPLLNEFALLENAPDPQERDDRKRAAAEHQIEAIRTGLKLHCRKLMTLRVNDPDFTEKMAASGEKLKAEASPASVSDRPDSTISMNKAC